MAKHRADRSRGRTLLRAGVIASSVPLALAAAGAASACGNPCPPKHTHHQRSSCDGVPTLSAFGDAGRFSEFSFGDANRGKSTGSDAEGAVAYGGNATFTNFFVGQYTGGATTPSLVVGKSTSGTLGMQSGAKGVVGGTPAAVQPGTSTLTTGVLKGSVPVDFKSTAYKLYYASQYWGSEDTSDDATVTTTGDALTLTGEDDKLNVFDLTPGQFAGARTIFVNVPVGSVTLINVPDSSIPSTLYQDFQYWNGTAYEAGGQYGSANEQAVQGATLLNFPKATTLTFGMANLAATVLAPVADFRFDGGQANGEIIAKTISGDFQSNLVKPFGGRCTCSKK